MAEPISIGTKQIGGGHPCLISLEPGATYRTAKEAQELLEAVAASGADAVKFQTFLPGDASRMMGERHDIQVSFGTKSGEKKESVFAALKRRELPKEEWKKLVEFTHEHNLLFITAPYFFETVEFLKEVSVDAIKVSKGDINNVLLIRLIAKAGLPVVLDAREKSEDLKGAVQLCEQEGNKRIVVMHCPSGYPAKDEDVHLRAIPFLKEEYGYPVGFADHSQGMVMNYAAVALGANMIEKTVTLEKEREQVEHYMSLEPEELSIFVKNIRSIETAMGSADVLFSSRVEETARRSLTTKRAISQGEEITEDLLDFRRPGNAGISVAQALSVLGKKAREDIPVGSFLQWDQLS